MNHTCPFCHLPIHKYSTIQIDKNHNHRLFFKCPKETLYWHDDIQDPFRASEYHIYTDINNQILRETFHLPNYYVQVFHKDPKTIVHKIVPTPNIKMVCYGGLPIEQQITDITLTELFNWDQNDIFKQLSQEQMEKKIKLYQTFQ